VLFAVSLLDVCPVLATVACVLHGPAAAHIAMQHAVLRNCGTGNCANGEFLPLYGLVQARYTQAAWRVSMTACEDCLWAIYRYLSTFPRCPLPALFLFCPPMTICAV